MAPSDLAATPKPSYTQSQIPEHIRTDLIASGTPHRFAPGETVFRKGDPGDHLIILETGSVEVSVTAVDGRKSVIATLGAGELLGEMAVLDGAARSADVQALEACEVHLVQRASVLNVVTQDPQAALWVIEVLCERLRNAADTFETLMPAKMASRLA